MMNNKWKIILIGVTCLAVGLFSVLPTIAIRFDMGSEFKGIWPERNGDRLYYFARIQEVLDGHEEINHPYFFEHKDETYPQATLAERFQAGLVSFVGMNVPDVQVLLDFLAPALICFLFYLVFTSLGVGWGYALTASALLSSVISGGFVKPVHPQLTLPLLLMFLLFWSKLVLGAKRLQYALIAGITLGLLFLTYFYHWSFIIVVLGLYCFVLLVRKDYSLLKYHAILLFVALLIGSPYLLSVSNGFDSPHHLETAIRVGVYYSHLPETIPRLLVGLLWFGFFLCWGYVSSSYAKKEYVVIAVLLAANVIYPNHQIISGLILQNANHWSFMPPFFFALGAAYVITETLKLHRVRTSLFVYLIIGLTGILFIVPAVRLARYNFSATQYVKTFAGTAEDISRQSYRPLLDWINSRSRDAVFFGSRDLLRFIPAYTHGNVYYTDYAFNLPGSDQEVVERALLSHYFDPEFFEDPNFGMSVDSRILWTQAAQTERNTHQFHRFFGISYEETYGLEQELSKVSDILGSLRAEGWNINLLKRYKIDYIIWDTKNDPKWKLDQYPELQKVTNIEDFEVYRFKDSQYLRKNE